MQHHVFMFIMFNRFHTNAFLVEVLQETGRLHFNWPFVFELFSVFKILVVHSLVTRKMTF